MAEGPKGPVSYFPAIEAKYGRSIADWKARMRATGLTSHKELVNWLKHEHGFGHGHAAAISKHLLDAGAPQFGADEQIDRLFPAAKAHWRPVYDALVAEITGFGDVKLVPKKTVVGIATRAQFAVLQPSTVDRFDVGLKLAGITPTDRLAAAGSWNTMMTHRVRLADPGEVDAELLAWLKQAYAAAL